MKKYQNIISLGYFCSPAIEFKRIERRQFSLPFDWLMTHDFSIVMDLISNNFKDFLNPEHMYQFDRHPEYYRNHPLDIDFFHDFSAFKSFDSQIGGVTEKYNRRIKRFYQVIAQPTLFLRYVNGKEIDYINTNYKHIVDTLQSFNAENRIIFVSNDDYCGRFGAKIPVYYVKKDPNANNARAFLDGNDELLNYITENVEKSATIKSNDNRFIKLAKNYCKKIKLKLNLAYRHDKIY